MDLSNTDSCDSWFQRGVTMHHAVERKTMNETLLEFCDSRGVSVRVDRSAGVIRGVKILGLRSRNGREYLPEALSRAAALYEGAKVNVNHPKGNAGAPRDYQDRIGIVRGVEVRPGEGLFGDLHFNPKHALAEQLIWDAEHAPENVGFSHNVQARTTRRDDMLVVEEITRVQSVDLVADPATTRGLYEATAMAGVEGAAETPNRGGGILPPITAAGSRSHETRADRGFPSVQPRPPAEQITVLEAEVERLRSELQALEARHAVALVENSISEELTAAGVPGTLVTELFRQQLRAAGNADARRQLIVERLQIARATGGTRPTSKEQYLAESFGSPRLPSDAKQFAELITA
jgi:hypothetical protein